jgi:hypothetical protein
MLLSLQQKGASVALVKGDGPANARTPREQAGGAADNRLLVQPRTFVVCALRLHTCRPLLFTPLASAAAADD